MRDPGVDERLKLCVVQLDGIPRAYTHQYNHLWRPAEPLTDSLDPGTRDPSLPRLSTQKLFAADSPDIYQHIDGLSEKAAIEHLGEILDYLDSLDVDLVVFPEYLIPASCLQPLIEFSSSRAVVAGMECVRNQRQAALLAEASGRRGDPKGLLRRNVSVLVADGCVHFITKKKPSAGEYIEPGTGPIVEEVVLRGRRVKLGVAVCMDYLRLEEDAREQRPEILCIPAFSPAQEPFKPDAPRDYVRLFANGARYGGSQIMVPDLTGVMTDENGAKAIQPGFEGIILIAYDRYPQRPTSLGGTNNQLLLRAEILQDSPENRVALNALQDLAAYADEDDQPVERLKQLIASWLDKIPAKSPMGEIFEVYRDTLAQGMEDVQIEKLARCHLVVKPGNRPGGVRRTQAEYIIGQLHTLASGGKPFGEAKDVYFKLCEGGHDLNSVEHMARGDLRAGPSSATTISMGTANSRGISAIPGDANSHSRVHPIDPSSLGPFSVDPYFDHTKAERLRICRDIEDRAQKLLNVMSRLAASASADDLEVVAQTCHFRAAGIGDLVTQLAEPALARSDFEWINVIGMVAQGVAQLQATLPSDASRARSLMTWGAGRSPLYEMAVGLHERSMRLLRLAE